MTNKIIVVLAALLLSAAAWAGDLACDNLTVNSNATVGGTVWAGVPGGDIPMGVFTNKPGGGGGGFYGAWEEVEGLPAGRGFGAAAAFQGKLFFVGGYGNWEQLKTNVFTYDGSHWSEVQGLPATLGRNPGLCVFNDRLYAFGGLSDQDMYVYDGTNWSDTGTDVPQNGSACGHTGHALDGKMWVVPCSDNDNAAAQTNLCYWDGANWSNGPAKPAIRWYTRPCMLSNKIFSAGGYCTNVYTFDGTSWGETVGFSGNFPWTQCCSNNLGGVFAMDGNLNLVTNIWSYGGSSWVETNGIPAAKMFPNLVNYQGDIYCLGGADSGYNGTTNVYRRVWTPN